MQGRDVIRHLSSGQHLLHLRSFSRLNELVTPLLKKLRLDVDDHKNYRPVTNMSTFSKILEKVALVRLKPHITSSPNYCPLQSAYLQLHSTKTALVKIVDDVLAAMDRGHAVTVVVLDMSSAFDAICHRLPLIDYTE